MENKWQNNETPRIRLGKLRRTDEIEGEQQKHSHTKTEHEGQKQVNLGQVNYLRA